MASATKKKKARMVWKKARIARNRSDVLTLAARRRAQREAESPIAADKE